MSWRFGLYCPKIFSIASCGTSSANVTESKNSEVVHPVVVKYTMVFFSLTWSTGSSLFSVQDIVVRATRADVAIVLSVFVMFCSK